MCFPNLHCLQSRSLFRITEFHIYSRADGCREESVMSNLRNILGKASDAFRNTTVVCEENKVNMLRMAAKTGSLNSHVSVISDFFQN